MRGYVKVMDDDALDGADICESAVLLLFHHIIIHYTYTLSPAREENDGENVEIEVKLDSDDEADDLEEGTAEKDENEPGFASILYFVLKIIDALNTLTLSLQSSVKIWS
jgi:hypothetical protein